eukprot:SAG11_NODE_5540_length_1531_cov_1.976257_2_plen_71_part_00
MTLDKFDSFDPRSTRAANAVRGEESVFGNTTCLRSLVIYIHVRNDECVSPAVPSSNARLRRTPAACARSL